MALAQFIVNFTGPRGQALTTTVEVEATTTPWGGLTPSSIFDVSDEVKRQFGRRSSGFSLKSDPKDEAARLAWLNSPEGASFLAKTNRR